MSDINNVTLTGTLSRDVDLRTTKNGKSVASFTLICEKDTGKAYVPCVAWEKAAEEIERNCRQGDRLGVQGAINTRSYEKDGKKTYVTEVTVYGYTFLNPPSENIVTSFDDIVF